MAERLSTGLADAINTVGSVKDIMDLGVIEIRSGSQPASADDAEEGVLLMLLTVDSLAFTPGTGVNGLSMGTSVDGVLGKAAETWSGVGLAAAGSGGLVAGHFRWYDKNYTKGASTTAVRMDGAIGASAAYELQMSNTTIVEAVAAVVQTFNYTTTRS